MDLLTQEGLTQCGMSRGIASNTLWGETGAESGPRLFRTSERGEAQSNERMASLARTIEAEIIPRLMLAHRALPQAEAPAEPQESGGMPEVAEFTGLILAHEIAEASAFIEGLRGRGVALDTIYLELLAPTARRLGEMWESDLSDFTEVTVGMWRLQQVLRELSGAFRGECDPWVRGRRALLVPMPGEQHTLGLFMVGEFFQRAGWDVWSEPPASRGALLEIVRAEWFDLVGLSAGCEARLDVLSSAIVAIRRASRNRAIGILVGGPVFVQHPEYVAHVGADAMAADARAAVTAAENVVALHERR